MRETLDFAARVLGVGHKEGAMIFSFLASPTLMMLHIVQLCPRL